MNQPARRSSLFKKSDNTPVESFPFEVLQYDLTTSPHCIYGKRIDNGQEVTVFLDQDPSLLADLSKLTHKRPEVMDFAAERLDESDKVCTEVGGALFANNAKMVSDGVYKSKWLHVISHYKDETEVVLATAHYHGVDYYPESQKVVGRITLIYDFDNSNISDEMYSALGNAQPVLVQSADELRQGLIKLLNIKMGAGVRMIAPTGEFDAVFLRDLRDNSRTPENAVDSFLAEKLPDGFGEMIQNQSVRVEIIPIKTMFLGGKTALDIYERIEKRKSAGGYDADTADIQRYLSESRSESGFPRRNMHYGRTVLGMRLSQKNDQTTDQRGVYLTFLKPLFQRSETVIGLGDALAYAGTQNFAPEKVYSPILPGASVRPRENSDDGRPSEDQPEPQSARPAPPPESTRRPAPSPATPQPAPANSSSRPPFRASRP